jgi:hypothetical protein
VPICGVVRNQCRSRSSSSLKTYTRLFLEFRPNIIHFEAFGSEMQSNDDSRGDWLDKG